MRLLAWITYCPFNLKTIFVCSPYWKLPLFSKLTIKETITNNICYFIIAKRYRSQLVWNVGGNRVNSAWSQWERTNSAAPSDWSLIGICPEHGKCNHGKPEAMVKSRARQYSASQPGWYIPAHQAKRKKRHDSKMHLCKHPLQQGGKE